MLSKAQIVCQEALDTCNTCIVKKSIRSGKTYCILDYAKSRKLKKVLWVVPFTDNVKGVFDEAAKWKIKLDLTVICYKSLKKYINKEFNLVVLDEVHWITMPYYNYVSQIKYEKLIGMTGTLPTSYVKKTILNDLNMRLVFEYSVKDAVIDKNVAPYDINIIKKELSNSKTILVEYKDKTTKMLKSFYTSEISSFNNLTSRLEKIDSIARQRLLRFQLLRFLNTLPSTINFVKKYIQDNRDKRFLVFVATQEMAEKCSEYCYYGGKNDVYFKLFQENKINHLVLVEKATVGVTYENLDQVLLTTINGSEASVQQKIFRAILFRPNYKAKIDILININTPQERWLQSSIQNII